MPLVCLGAMPAPAAPCSKLVCPWVVAAAAAEDDAVLDDEMDPFDLEDDLAQDSNALELPPPPLFLPPFAWDLPGRLSPGRGVGSG
jgi:hypothetical protein